MATEVYKCYHTGYSYRVIRSGKKGRPLLHRKKLWCALCQREHNLVRVA